MITDHNVTLFKAWSSWEADDMDDGDLYIDSDYINKLVKQVLLLKSVKVK